MFPQLNGVDFSVKESYATTVEKEIDEQNRHNELQELENKIELREWYMELCALADNKTSII